MIKEISKELKKTKISQIFLLLSFGNKDKTVNTAGKQQKISNFIHIYAPVHDGKASIRKSSRFYLIL